MAAVETYPGSSMDVVVSDLTPTGPPEPAGQESRSSPAAQLLPSSGHASGSSSPAVGGPVTNRYGPATSTAPSPAPVVVPQSSIRGTKSSSPPSGAASAGVSVTFGRSASQPAAWQAQAQTQTQTQKQSSLAPSPPSGQLQASVPAPQALHASPKASHSRSRSPAPTPAGSSVNAASSGNAPTPTWEVAITTALTTDSDSDTNNIVASIKREVLKRLTAEDLDQYADDILSRASNQFMDRALARRLETIGARDLINALARAERLGYDVDDVVEGGKPGSESELVIPSNHSGALYPPNMQPPPPPSALPHPATPRVPSHLMGKWRSSQQQPNSTPNALTPSTAPGVTSATKRPVPGKLPPPIVLCTICNRPCSSYEALNCHNKKSGCNTKPSYQFTGKDTCLHCGCTFSSPMGLNYHTKCNVCGKHSEETEKNMLYLLYSYPGNPQASSGNARVASPMATPQSRTPGPGPGPGPASVPRGFVQPQTPSSSQQSPATIKTPRSNYDTGPYAHLTPEQRYNFEQEMKRAEDKYGELMQAAMELPHEEAVEELSKLKNRFNTKQSTTRKKYGIRLREKRTAAEIEAERIRLVGYMGGPVIKRARINGDAGATPSSQAASQAASQASSLPIHESPRKRVPLSEMGGLVGSQATAELVDPTARVTPAQWRPEQKPQPQPQPQPEPQPARVMHAGTPDDPMQIDDESDGDSDDGDIPARLPASQGGQAAVPHPG